MSRKLLLVAFVLALALTVIAARHQLTNASPNVAPPPRHAPPLEQMEALSHSGTGWQVVAGGGGRDWTLFDVSMTSSAEGWAEGWAAGVMNPSSYGVMMHYTNTTWSRTEIPTGTYAIDAVSIISPTEGWAAAWVSCSYGCDQGLLLHYTGSAGWQKVAPPARPGGDYWGGFRSLDITGTIGWMVGSDYGYFLQFDGTSWTPASAPDINATGVSIVDANEAWAVGNIDPRMAHFSGGSWSAVTPTVPGFTYLKGIHMLDASNGWAVGDVRLGTSPNYSYRCITLRYDGSDWSEVTCPSSDIRLYSVRMRSPTDVWAVGSGGSSQSSGVILHYDGSQWTLAAAPFGTPRLRSVRLEGTDEGWVVGEGGTILRLVGGNWARVEGPRHTVGPMDSVSTDEAWFGGNAGQLYQWQDGTIVTHTSPLTTPIIALDMVSSTLGWAATDQPALNVLRYSEGAWTTWPFSQVNSISMVGSEEGWFALGQSPGMMRYNTGTWQAQSVGGTSRVDSVCMLNSNYGWATAGSSVYTYTGGIWNAVNPQPAITGNWAGLTVVGISLDEAWVAGYSVSCTTVECPVSPQLAHFSGGIWTSIAVSDWQTFNNISKVSATEWWATGRLMTGEYAFLHYKDGTYTTVSSAGEDVIGVSMLPNGFGFARGVGSLLRLRPAGVSLAPSQGSTVFSGQSITYQHTLTNTGLGTDSFTVTASIDRPGWSVMAAPSLVGPLASGGSSGVVVTVTAPSGITTTVTAAARITATSQLNSSVTSAVVDVTTGLPYQIYLPVVLRQ